jgi:hypothetical protein
MMIAETARMPPTLTSMPPMIITSVMPALTIASSSAVRSVWMRLIGVRK